MFKRTDIKYIVRKLWINRLLQNTIEICIIILGNMIEGSCVQKRIILRNKSRRMHGGAWFSSLEKENEKKKPFSYCLRSCLLIHGHGRDVLDSFILTI